MSDEIRLLRLIARHSQADLPIAVSLQAVGELFGTQPQASAGGVYRLSDSTGASITLAAPLPGERERACELITAPLAADDHDTLALLLDCIQYMIRVTNSRWIPILRQCHLGYEDKHKYVYVNIPRLDRPGF